MGFDENMGFENENKDNADCIEFGEVVDHNGNPVCSEEQPVPKTMVGFAVASMILGIVSMLICCCSPIVTAVCSAVGIALGILALVKKYSGKGMAIAGLICGGIAFLASMIALTLNLMA